MNYLFKYHGREMDVDATPRGLFSWWTLKTLKKELELYNFSKYVCKRSENELEHSYIK